MRLASSSGGPHGEVFRRGVGLGSRLREVLGQAVKGVVEKSIMSQGRVFPGGAHVTPLVVSGEEKEERVEAARHLSGETLT